MHSILIAVFQLMYELVGVLKTIILELFIQQENNCQPRRISQMHNTLIQLHSGRIWTFGTFCTFCAKLIEWPPSIGKVSLATSRLKHNIIHHHYDFVISRCRFKGRAAMCANHLRISISAASLRVRNSCAHNTQQGNVLVGYLQIKSTWQVLAIWYLTGTFCT